MEVNLASQTHHIPQVGLPHREPVTIEIKQKRKPTGAKLFDINESNLILKIKEQIDAIPIKPKQARANRDAGT